LHEYFKPIGYLSENEIETDFLFFARVATAFQEFRVIPF